MVDRRERAAVVTDIGSRMILMGALVCTVVGAFDAAVSQEWDLLVIFGLIGGLLAAFWIRQRAHRITVGLRPDLAHWLSSRSERSGEPFEDALDRAVSAYRHGMVADDGRD